MCLVLGSKAFTVLFFVLRFQYNGLRYDPALTAAIFFAISDVKCFSQDTSRAIIFTESTSDQSTAVAKRSSGRKRYYPP